MDLFLAAWCHGGAAVGFKRALHWGWVGYLAITSVEVGGRHGGKRHRSNRLVDLIDRRPALWTKSPLNACLALLFAPVSSASQKFVRPCHKRQK